jgi:hypothetical protein
VFDDVEGVDTNESLFKIELSDLFVREIHIDTDIFDVQKLLRAL